jgi:hypothetical protein
MDLTKQQEEVLLLLKEASMRYKFLLYLISSSSFRFYYKMVSMLSVLPVHGHRAVYINYLQKFQPNTSEDTEQIEKVADADDVQLDDSEEAPFEGVS